MTTLPRVSLVVPESSLEKAWRHLLGDTDNLMWSDSSTVFSVLLLSVSQWLLEGLMIRVEAEGTTASGPVCYDWSVSLGTLSFPVRPSLGSHHLLFWEADPGDLSWESRWMWQWPCLSCTFGTPKSVCSPSPFTHLGAEAQQRTAMASSLLGKNTLAKTPTTVRSPEGVHLLLSHWGQTWETWWRRLVSDEPRLRMTKERCT